MKHLLSFLTFVTFVLCAPWPLAASSKRTGVVERAPAASQPTPLSIEPSEYWDGDDGRWSTFGFQVGTPAQQIRLLPGTSTSAVYYIDPQGCSATAGDTSDCPQSRGGTFNANGSSTWTNVGNFQYAGNFSQTSLLNIYANSHYGDDTVTLAWPGSPGPTIQNQIIGGLVEKSIWYIGNFGISPRALNVTTISNSHTSPVQNLRSQNLIPSTSWAYTAGFNKNAYPIFGSLTLGGYDTTRFRANSISFPFGNDISRDLLVSVQAIASPEASNAGSLTPDGPFNAYIDSTIPTLWLPTSACQAFEKAFGITWDDQNHYYLLTDDQHQNLLNTNPSVTFTLGSSLAGGPTVDIVLPYAAFDLQLTSPIAEQPTNYFPLQRAANSTQYVLGRTFLQHAYVIADYDRSNFTVAQALFPQQGTKPNIVPIYAPGQGPGMANAGAANDGASAAKSSGISAGAIAGIVVGVVAALAVLVAGFFLFRARQRSKRQTPSPAPPHQSGSMPALSGGFASPSTTQGESPSVYEKDTTRAEGVTPLSEHVPMSPAIAGKTELSAEDRKIHEAPVEGKGKRGELDASPAPMRHEMDASQEIMEMDGSEVAGKKGEKGARRYGRGSGDVFEMEGEGRW